MTRDEFWAKWKDLGYEVAKLNPMSNGVIPSPSIGADMLIEECETRFGWVADNHSRYTVPENVPWEEFKADVLTLSSHAEFAEKE